MMSIALIILFIFQTGIHLVLADDEDNTNCSHIEEYIKANDNISNVTLPWENSTQQHPIYPDLRCHKGYYINNSVQSGSEKILKSINKNCTEEAEMSDDMCFKKCVFQGMNIITKDNELNPELVIAEFLELVISFNQQKYAGKKISKIIHQNCAQIYDQVRFNHCSDWTEFYECVDKAWKCTTYRTRMKERKIRRIVVQYNTKCYTQVLK